MKNTQLIKDTVLFNYLRGLLILKDVDVTNLLTVQVKQEGELVLINEVALVDGAELDPIIFDLDLSTTVYMVEEEQEELTPESYNPMNLSFDQLKELAEDYEYQLDMLKFERHQLALEIEELTGKKSIVLEALAQKILDNSEKKEKIH